MDNETPKLNGHPSRNMNYRGLLGSESELFNSGSGSIDAMPIGLSEKIEPDLRLKAQDFKQITNPIDAQLKRFPGRIQRSPSDLISPARVGLATLAISNNFEGQTSRWQSEPGYDQSDISPNYRMRPSRGLQPTMVHKSKIGFGSGPKIRSAHNPGSGKDEVQIQRSPEAKQSVRRTVNSEAKQSAGRTVSGEAKQSVRRTVSGEATPTPGENRGEGTVGTAEVRDIRRDDRSGSGRMIFRAIRERIAGKGSGRNEVQVQGSPSADLPIIRKIGNLAYYQSPKSSQSNKIQRKSVKWEGYGNNSQNIAYRSVDKQGSHYVGNIPTSTGYGSVVNHVNRPGEKSSLVSAYENLILGPNKRAESNDNLGLPLIQRSAAWGSGNDRRSHQIDKEVKLSNDSGIQTHGRKLQRIGASGDSDTSPKDLASTDDRVRTIQRSVKDGEGLSTGSENKKSPEDLFGESEIEFLSDRIYDYLKHRLYIENERMGWAGSTRWNH